MSLKHSSIEHIAMLAGAANALSCVTSSDAATNAVLRQIEALANDTPAKPKDKTLAERIAEAKNSEGATAYQTLYGLLKNMCQDPETKIGDLKLVALALGHRGVAVGLV